MCNICDSYGVDNSFEINIETDTNPVEIKTEADSNDIAECPHIDRRSIDVFIGLFNIYVA